MTPVLAGCAPINARSTLALFALALCLAAPSPAHAADPAQHYARGKAAFDRPEPDYVTALRHLSAYRELAADLLADNTSFRQNLDRAIEHSVAQLDLALRTKRQLDQYGEVREVTVTTGGKLDDFGDGTVERAVRLPRGQVPPKPALASEPPSPRPTPVLHAEVAERKLEAGKVKSTLPTKPRTTGDTDCERRLESCREKAAAQTERLRSCERKLDTVAEKFLPGGSSELAACRKRLDDTTEKYDDFQERYQDLLARYRALLEKCSGR